MLLETREDAKISGEGFEENNMSGMREGFHQ